MIKYENVKVITNDNDFLKYIEKMKKKNEKKFKNKIIEESRFNYMAGKMYRILIFTDCDGSYKTDQIFYEKDKDGNYNIFSRMEE